VAFDSPKVAAVCLEFCLWDVSLAAVELLGDVHLPTSAQRLQLREESLPLLEPLSKYLAVEDRLIWVISFEDA
jgi:hypothetical protein